MPSLAFCHPGTRREHTHSAQVQVRQREMSTDSNSTSDEGPPLPTPHLPHGEVWTSWRKMHGLGAPCCPGPELPVPAKHTRAPARCSQGSGVGLWVLRAGRSSGGLPMGLWLQRGRAQGQQGTKGPSGETMN